jgi:hypothetical protein
MTLLRIAHAGGGALKRALNVHLALSAAGEGDRRQSTNSPQLRVYVSSYAVCPTMDRQRRTSRAEPRAFLAAPRISMASAHDMKYRYN